VLDYREENVFVTWLEKDEANKEPDAPMEIGNRYVSQIFRPETVTADPMYVRPKRAKRTDSDGGEFVERVTVAAYTQQRQRGKLQLRIGRTQ
jgi:hypothetical protein